MLHKMLGFLIALATITCSTLVCADDTVPSTSTTGSSASTSSSGVTVELQKFNTAPPSQSVQPSAPQDAVTPINPSQDYGAAGGVVIKKTF